MDEDRDIEIIAAAASAAFLGAPPTSYLSNREGRIEIAKMDSRHAERAAKAVAEGRRPANPPSVVRPLRAQARRHQKGGL